MKLTLNTKITAGIIGAIILAGLILAFGQYSLGSITNDNPVKENRSVLYTFFATSTNQTWFATSTSATSTSITQWTDSNGRVDNGYMVIDGAKRVQMFFSRGDTKGVGNSGSTIYEVEVSPNGTDWYDYNKLVQNLATSTVSTTLSRITIGAGTSTTMVSLDLDRDTFYGLRCIVIETTDGEHSCKALADF